jgi:osmotically-inducible protein OsmY
VDGVVYLMGIAQDQAELDRVRDLARHTSGVKDVVSYVRLKSDLPNPIIPAKPATS